MSKYEILKMKYDTLVKKEVSRNKNILMESFIEYYGEKHCSTIMRKFSEISWVYYINWDTILECVRVMGPRLRSIYGPLFEFAAAKEDSHSFLFQKKYFPSNFIGATDSSIFEFDNIYNHVLEKIQGNEPVNFTYGNHYDEKRIICFQLFITSEQDFIHEINHALTREWILEIVEDDYSNGSLIEKVGAKVYDSEEVDEIYLEELLNDKASIAITEIFKRRGGELSSFLIGNIFKGSYKFNYYLVDEFFFLFEEFIKEARITENKNELVSRIGKKNYIAFCKLVQRYYSFDHIPSVEVRKSVLQDISNLLFIMKDYFSKESVLRGDLKDYCQYLKDEGYNVTILNHQGNDSHRMIK